MKRFIKSLVLVTFVFGITLPAWSQASTEGKDFWVANTIVCQPPSASGPAFPTIAVSAQKACKVTITDYAGNQLATADVTAGSWTRFGENTAAVDPADYYLDPSKWYPTTNNVNATDVYKHADKTNNYGLHITATENVSVFVIMRTPQYSMDASNALPITALQSEYYLQDFYPDANGVDKPVTMTTILATENNTKVVITPRGNTYGKNNSGNAFTVSLNQGQTYYLISEVNSQLAGTHIEAQDGKKIAVYVGSPVTRLPGGVAARDGLFEQMMPIDYWGTQFIVTRSMQKDANIIGITATQNGTTVSIDGFEQTTIGEGDTYYVLLQSASDPYAAKLSNITCHIDQVITADEAYIETSCPCAVISYDTGNSFAGKTGSEIVNGQGDPSSVWMSPIQQKINSITFGACYTKKTQAHFLNVVTETGTCASTTLTAYNNQSPENWSDKLSWTAVPGNPKYSYARVQIGNNTPNIKVFTLENRSGFIAHVYGNGEDESYAYSAGSAAVERCVYLGTLSFSDGEKDPTKYVCVNQDDIEFNASGGVNEITRVDWNFGDGVSMTNAPAQIKHAYTTPGWYDVTANLYGHQVCADADEVPLGAISFSIRVIRPYIKYVPVLDCKDPDETLPPDAPEPIDENLCQDTIIVPYYIYRHKSFHEENLGVFWDSAYIFNEWRWDSGEAVDTLQNAVGCDSVLTVSWKIISRLDFRLDTAQAAACDSVDVEVPYFYRKGEIGDAWLIDKTNNNKKIVVDPAYLPMTVPAGYKDIFSLPTKDFRPGVYDLEFHITDGLSEELGEEITEFVYPLQLTVRYSEYIFKRKFNNVLAVYKKGKGGNAGYTFTGYQWYYRDESDNEAPIEGATSSVYYSQAPLATGWYFVELTDADKKLTLRSCEQYIDQDELPDFSQTDDQSAAAPQKLLKNQRIFIQLDDKLYDIYGQRVQ